MAQQDHFVFVVDDDDAVRESLQVVLETAGYQTQVYASGAEFLAEIKDSRRGCVLLDVRMPHMSGLTVLQRLRAVRTDLPVIMITGSGDTATAEEAVKAGAVNCIEKPVLEASLFAHINSAFARM